MRVYFNDPDFPAVLKDAQGRVLAEGYANLVRDSKCVEFKSDFVPLYPLGTPLSMDRLFDGEAIHQFWGEVYLADKKLVRLVNVKSQALPGAEDIYCFDVSIPATLRDTERQEPPKKFGLFRRKAEEETGPYPVRINMLSGKRFEFSSTQMFEAGQRFFMSVSGPLPLDDIPIRIHKVYAFSGDIAHLCEFEDVSSATQERLREFLHDLIEKNSAL